MDLNKQNKIYHNQQVVSMKYQFLFIISFECNQNGRNLNYLSPFFEPWLHWRRWIRWLKYCVYFILFIFFSVIMVQKNDEQIVFTGYFGYNHFFFDLCNRSIAIPRQGDEFSNNRIGNISSIKLTQNTNTRYSSGCANSWCNDSFWSDFIKDAFFVEIWTLSRKVYNEEQLEYSPCKQ